MIKWFLDPPHKKGGLLGRVVQGTSAMVYGLLGYVFGNEFLDDLAEFLTLFKDMVDDFRERHDEVQRIFHDHRTTFITICAPTEPSVEVAGFFAEELGRRGYPRGGTVVNQVHRCNDEPLEAGVLLGEDARALAHDLAPRTAASRSLPFASSATTTAPLSGRPSRRRRRYCRRRRGQSRAARWYSLVYSLVGASATAAAPSPRSRRATASSTRRPTT